MQRLAQAGLIRVVEGHAIMMMPNGSYMLNQIKQVLAEELKQFNPQQVQLCSNPSSHIHAAPTPNYPLAPYDTSLSTQLPLLTQMILPEFEQAKLTSACITTQTTQQPSSNPNTPTPRSSTLWSGSKQLHDIALFLRGRHSSALDAYSNLIDSLLLCVEELGSKAVAVEVDYSPQGPSEVDADHAHEIHALERRIDLGGEAANEKQRSSSSSNAATTVLVCDKCNYASLPERAVSIPPDWDPTSEPTTDHTSTTPPSSTEHASIFPASLDTIYRRWLLDSLRSSLQPHTLDRLALDNDKDKQRKWRCEMLVPKDMHESNGLYDNSVDGQQTETNRDPLLYLVLLRSSDELNLHAVENHVGVARGSLRRVDDLHEAGRILRQMMPRELVEEWDVAWKSLDMPSAISCHSSSSTPPLPPRFDPTPELLFDQCFVPYDVDLDMELIEHRRMEAARAEAEERRAEEERAIQEAERAAASVAVSDPDQVHPTSKSSKPSSQRSHSNNNHPTFDPSLLSEGAHRLSSGQSIDLVELDMKAHGLSELEVARTKEQMVRMAQTAQKEEMERKLREKEEELRREQMRAQLEEQQDGEIPPDEPIEEPTAAAEAVYNPTEEEFHADMAAAAAAHAASSSSSSATSSTSFSFHSGSSSSPSFSSHSSSLSSSGSSLFHPQFSNSYSRQGFFRRVLSGDRCTMVSCDGGILREWSTNIVGNVVFVGKQIIEVAQPTGAAAAVATSGIKGKLNAAPRKKKYYLHTTFARFSPHDLLTHIVLNHFIPPSSPPDTSKPMRSMHLIQSLHAHHSRLALPPLLTPNHVAIIPVRANMMAAGSGTQSVRDLILQRRQAHTNNKSSTAAAMTKEMESLMAASKKLYDGILDAASTSTSTSDITDPRIAELLRDLPPLTSRHLLIDDKLDEPTPRRLARLVSSGVPILLLVHPQALSKGYATLLLNRRSASVEPRNIALDGLADLCARMVWASFTELTRTRQKYLQQQISTMKEEDHEPDEEE